jgi:hypothetical protein
MKKIFLPFLFSAILLIGNTAFGQNSTITMGIRGNACDQLVVEWNSSYAFTNAPYNAWTQATLTITWPQALGASVLGTITSYLPGFTGWQYNGSAVLNGSVYQREVILLSGAYNQNIPVGVTEIIAITLSGTGTGDFTIADPFGNTNISNGYYGTGIWTGSFSPATATGVYLDDRIAWDGTKWCGGSGTNYQPGAGDTKPCYIMGLNGHLTSVGANIGSLTILAGGQLYIDPGASLTNSGVTSITQPQGLVIAANAGGSGSYIDNGTISYVGSGSAEVQTYINNTATAGSFHIHQIGPTVKNSSFGTSYPGETGVFLGEFDLQANGTYAYRYSESSNTWTNFWQTTEPVPTGCGFIVSDISGAPSTLSMVGQLATDDGCNTTWNATPSGASTLPSWAVSYSPAGGQGNFLASNPYPSGLDLKAFWLAIGTAGFETTMRIWDHSSGAYATVTRRLSPLGWLYTGACVGTNGLINPGQGFFVTANSSFIGSFGDQLFFCSTYRAHYSGPFIKEAEEVYPNTLTLNASTSANYSKNDLIIYFAEGLSAGHDPYDADHWASMYEEALEVYSVSADNQELTVNAMPPLEDLVSIPVYLDAGQDGMATFNFSGFDTFEAGTEIYLEDTKLGGNWINLISNPVYQFAANTFDPLNRFVLHFFGPTGIDDPNKAEEAISIYSYHRDAYIVNRGTETIEEYMVYDMMGRLLQKGSLPNSTVNKVFIGEISNYYIVKVVTNGRTYSEKVFISR